MLLSSPLAGPLGDSPLPGPLPNDPHRLDHAADALARLPRQFQGQPNIEKLVRAMCEPIQVFEDLAVQVLLSGTIDDAIGDDLIVLGKIVGQGKGAVTDDEVFRRLIKARIITNRSIGVSSDLIRITRLIIDSPGTDVDVEPRSVATVRVTLTPLSDITVIPTLLSFLNLARGQAIRIVIQFSLSTPDAFRFDSGPGFDRGHLAGSVETT